MTVVTKAMSVVVLVTLCLALAAWAAEPPTVKGGGEAMPAVYSKAKRAYDPKEFLPEGTFATLHRRAMLRLRRLMGGRDKALSLLVLEELLHRQAQPSPSPCFSRVSLERPFGRSSVTRWPARTRFRRWPKKSPTA